MKKINLLKKAVRFAAIALCAVPIISSCEPSDENEGNEIALSTPANNATFDLSAIEKITFSWGKVEGVSAYTLRFSESATEVATSDVKREAGDTTSFDLTAQEADQMMRLYTDVAPGEAGSIYWTVTGGDAQTQVRKFTLKRLPASSGEEFISLSTDSLVFAAVLAEPAIVQVNANVAWEVESNAAWLTVEKGDGIITITASTNIEAAERHANVTVFGGENESKVISVKQLGAVSGGDATLMQGTWHLKKAEFIYSLDETITMTGEVMTADQFTLNENGTWTGEIQIPINSWSVDGTPDHTRTWTFEGGVFTFTEDSNIASWRAAPSASELLLEVGNAGQGGYRKASYTKTPNTIPPMPQPADISPYTGNESMLCGEWVLTTEENCTPYSAVDSRPYWVKQSYKASDNLVVYTINADHTYSMKMYNEATPSTGTWNFNAATGVVTATPTGGGSAAYTIESATNAATLVWGEFATDSEGTRYSRTTFSKKN